MDFEKKKEGLKKALIDLRAEATHLVSNIDVALLHMHEIRTEEDAFVFFEKYAIERGLEHIEIFQGGKHEH